MLIRLILCISQVVIERVDRGRFTKASTRSARDDRLDESSNFVQEGRRGGGSVRGVRERIRDISILLILEPCPRVAPTRASSFGSDDKRIECRVRPFPLFFAGRNRCTRERFNPVSRPIYK